MSGPKRVQMFNTLALKPMFHDATDIIAEETWPAPPTGDDCYETCKSMCVSVDDERPGNCCNIFKYRAAAHEPLQKSSKIKSLVELGLPYGGGSCKILKSGHVVITQASGVSADTVVMDVSCVQHIEVLTANDLHDSKFHIAWCCCMPCCGQFPELRDRVRLLASDEIDISKCGCCKSWLDLPGCCFPQKAWKQVIAEFQVEPGKGEEFARIIRDLQAKVKTGNDGRCFKVLELNDIQGRFVTKGTIKVLSPEGSIELPHGAMQIKDAEELLLMNEEELIKFIETRGGVVLANIPYILQAQQLYHSQQCERYVEEEFPRETCCGDTFQSRKNCLFCNVRPFCKCNLPLNGARRDAYYKTETH